MFLEVEDRVAAACKRAGRERSDVTLIAVSKRQPADRLVAAYRAGARTFGENYAQELLAKKSAVEATLGASVEWHHIGALQRNKVGRLVGEVACFHGVDSARLLDRVNTVAAGKGVTMPLFLQVNLGAEATKSGCPPTELADLAGQCAVLTHVVLRGLMVIPPPGSPEETRPYFRQLRDLATAVAEKLGCPPLALSMGMSADFETAIEEGATHVRVGSAIFGARAIER